MSNPDDFHFALSQAAKVKEAQLKADPSRKSWEEAPDFFKWTCGEYPHVLEARQKPAFLDRLSIAEQLKESGNQLFVEDKLQDALVKYSNAIAVFVWFQRKNGRSIEEVSLQQSLLQLAREDRLRAEAHLAACFLNAAAICLRTRAHADAIYSCDKALQYMPNNAKAFFRRAQANYALATSYTLELAVQDLQRAAKLMPCDPAIRQSLTAWKAELAEQTAKDKRTFGSMLTRGSIYPDVEPGARQSAPCIPAGTEDVGLGWVRPPFSEQALQQAQEMGIDLADPAVQAELMQLHERKLSESDASSSGGDNRLPNLTPKLQPPPRLDPEGFVEWWQALLTFKLRWRWHYLIYILLWCHAIYRTYKIFFNLHPSASGSRTGAAEEL